MYSPRQRPATAFSHPLFKRDECIAKQLIHLLHKHPLLNKIIANSQSATAKIIQGYWRMEMLRKDLPSMEKILFGLSREDRKIAEYINVTRNKVMTCQKCRTFTITTTTKPYVDKTDSRILDPTLTCDNCHSVGEIEIHKVITKVSDILIVIVKPSATEVPASNMIIKTDNETISFQLEAFIDEKGDHSFMSRTFSEGINIRNIKFVCLFYRKYFLENQSIDEVHNELYIEPRKLEKPECYYAGVCGLLFVPAFLQLCCKAEQKDMDNVMALVPDAIIQSLLPKNELFLLRVIQKVVKSNKDDTTVSIFTEFENLAKSLMPEIFTYKVIAVKSKYILPAKRFDFISSEEKSLNSILCRIPKGQERNMVHWLNPPAQEAERPSLSTFPTQTADNPPLLARIFPSRDQSVSQCLKLGLITKNGGDWVYHYFTELGPLLILHFENEEGEQIEIEEKISTAEFALQDQEYRLAAVINKTETTLKIGKQWFSINQNNDVSPASFPKLKSCKIVVYELASTPSSEESMPDRISTYMFFSTASKVLFDIIKQSWNSERLALKKMQSIQLTKEITDVLAYTLMTIEFHYKQLKDSEFVSPFDKVLHFLRNFEINEKVENLAPEILNAIESKNREKNDSSVELLNHIFTRSFEYWFKNSGQKFSLSEVLQSRCYECFTLSLRSCQNTSNIQLKLDPNNENTTIKDLFKLRFCQLKDTKGLCMVCHRCHLKRHKIIVGLHDILIVTIKGKLKSNKDISSDEIDFNEFTPVGGRYELFSMLNFDETHENRFMLYVRHNNIWWKIDHTQGSVNLDGVKERPHQGRIFFYRKKYSDVYLKEFQSIYERDTPIISFIYSFFTALFYINKKDPLLPSQDFEEHLILKAAKQFFNTFYSKDANFAFLADYQIHKKLIGRCISQFINEMSAQLNNSPEFDSKFAIELKKVAICSECFTMKNFESSNSKEMLLDLFAPLRHAESNAYTLFITNEYFSQAVYSSQKSCDCEVFFREVKSKKLVRSFPQSIYIDIETCLQHRFRMTEERLTCSNCQMKTIHYAQQSIQQLGDYLIINLEREELTMRVHFPFELSLSQYLHDGYVYELLAIIERVNGDTGTGKYSTIVNIDGSWLKIELKKPVERVTLGHKLLTHANVLIYRRSEKIIQKNGSQHNSGAIKRKMTAVEEVLLNTVKTVINSENLVEDLINGLSPTHAAEIAYIEEKPICKRCEEEMKEEETTKYTLQMVRTEDCSSVKEMLAKTIMTQNCCRCDCQLPFKIRKSIVQHFGPFLVCQISNSSHKPFHLNEDIDMDYFIMTNGSYELFAVIVVAWASRSMYLKQDTNWIKSEGNEIVIFNNISLEGTLLLLYRSKKFGKPKHELKQLDELTKNAFFCTALYSEKFINNTTKLSNIGRRLHTLLSEYIEMKTFLKELITNLELDIGLTDAENIVEHILKGATTSSHLSVDIQYTCETCNHTQHLEKSKQILIMKPPIEKDTNLVTLHACYEHTSRRHRRKTKQHLCSACKSEGFYYKQKNILTVGSILVINVKKSDRAVNGVEFPKRLHLSEFGLNLREFELAGVILDGEESDEYLQCAFNFDGHWVKFVGTVQRHHVKIDPSVLSRAHYVVYKEVKEEISTDIAETTTRSWAKIKHIELNPPVRGIINDGKKCVFITLLSILYYSQPMWNYLKKSEISLSEEFVNFLLRFQDKKVSADQLKTEMNQIISKYSQVDIDEFFIPEAVFLQFVKGLIGEDSSKLFAVHRKIVCFCGHVIASEGYSDYMLAVYRTSETNLKHYVDQRFQNSEYSMSLWPTKFHLRHLLYKSYFGYRY